MKKPDTNEIIELWLKKYHGITVEELIKKHPKLVKSPRWFLKYAVTQEQYDEWRKEVETLLSKKYRFSKQFIKHGWWSIELTCAPSIKEK